MAQGREIRIRQEDFEEIEDILQVLIVSQANENLYNDDDKHSTLRFANLFVLAYIYDLLGEIRDYQDPPFPRDESDSESLSDGEEQENNAQPRGRAGTTPESSSNGCSTQTSPTAERRTMRNQTKSTKVTKGKMSPGAKT